MLDSSHVLVGRGWCGKGSSSFVITFIARDCFDPRTLEGRGWCRAVVGSNNGTGCCLLLCDFGVESPHDSPEVVFLWSRNTRGRRHIFEDKRAARHRTSSQLFSTTIKHTDAALQNEALVRTHVVDYSSSGDAATPEPQQHLLHGCVESQLHVLVPGIQAAHASTRCHMFSSLGNTKKGNTPHILTWRVQLGLLVEARPRP